MAPSSTWRERKDDTQSVQDTLKCDEAFPSISPKVFDLA